MAPHSPHFVTRGDLIITSEGSAAVTGKINQIFEIIKEKSKVKVHILVYRSELYFTEV